MKGATAFKLALCRGEPARRSLFQHQEASNGPREDPIEDFSAEAMTTPGSQEMG